MARGGMWCVITHGLVPVYRAPTKFRFQSKALRNLWPLNTALNLSLACNFMCHKLRLGRVVTLFIGLLSFGDRITMAALSCDGYLNKGPIYKVVLLGEAGVGKTALFQRGKDNSFHGERTSRSTIGIDSCSKYVMVDDLEVTVGV